MKTISQLLLSACAALILFTCTSAPQDHLNNAIAGRYYNKDLSGVIKLAESSSVKRITSFASRFLIAKSYFFLAKENAEYSSNAEKLLLELVKDEPHFTEAYVFLSRHYYYNLNNSEKAVTVLKTILQYEPDNIKANSLLFKIFSSAGNQDGAKASAGYILLYENEINEAQQFLKKVR